MIITEIKRKGNSNLYHVYINNEYFGFIAYDYVYKYKLKEGLELENEQLLKMQEESDNFVCANFALKYISKKFCSEYDLKTYLKKHKFSENGITNAIEKLKDYGYLNDKAWAESMANSLKSSHGKKYIRQQLELKKVDESVINDVLENLKQEENYCLNIAKKWTKIHGEINTINDKAKITRHLLSKGFNYDEVNLAIKNISNMESEYDWY